MGLVIGIPLAVFVHRVFTSKRGKMHAVKELLSFLYLKILRRGIKRRIHDLHDIMSDDPFKLALLILPTERYLEFPRNDLEQREDSFRIFGSNSQKELLTVQITKVSSEYAKMWIHLRLANGKNYNYTASEKLIKIPKTSENTFAAGGLRMRCITPMRKWRISYCGLLNERNDEIESGQSVFVKFSFLWTASSKAVDFSTDTSLWLLANHLASKEWDGWLPDISRISMLEKYLDTYEQAGMLEGTVVVQGQEEKEVYLWGGRKRSYVPAATLDESFEFFGNLKDGDYFSISRMKLPGDEKCFEYGCVMMPTGFVHSMNDFRLNIFESQNNQEMLQIPGVNVSFKRDKIDYNIQVVAPSSTLRLDKSRVYTAPITMEYDEGHAVIIYSSRYLETTAIAENVPQSISPSLDAVHSSKGELVVKIENLTYRDVDIAGGKGASLSHLNHLSERNNKFCVPQGVVVTTKAYEHFIQTSRSVSEIEQLQDAAWKKMGDLKETCRKVVTKMSGEKLPENIILAIRTVLDEVFGKDAVQSKKFAVRSSALGEDSEDLSAAGQMETFLGICGLEQVFMAVVKCWASQFSYTAVQYKRQNGQLLNMPMAVVVQEMVPADASGVIFTCDPVSGNPSLVTVTANYGLGESVVSASEEPDTVIFERNEKNELKLHSLEIGQKTSKIVMSEVEGVVQTKLSENDSARCCIDSDSALLLSQVALEVESSFGCYMDLEWSLQNKQIYLLQARPVTTFDKETEFEIRHGLNFSLPSEFEYTSTANVGEVMPGSMTPLGMSTINNLFIINIAKKWCARSDVLFPFNPYMMKGFAVNQNHMLFNLLDTLLRFHKDNGSIISDSQVIAMFGRVLDDKEMMDAAKRRNAKDTSKSFAPLQIAYFLGDILFCGRRLRKAGKMINETDSKINVDDCTTAYEIFMKIAKHTVKGGELMTTHGDCSMTSSMVNLAVLTALRTAKGGWHADVFSDFATLLSDCPKVESVDVPCAMEQLSEAILKSVDSATFQKMESQEALEWLKKTDSEASQMFQQFLKNHGHRCIKEFDVHSSPWGYDALPLVTTLQSMVAGSRRPKKVPTSVKEALLKLKVPADWKIRLLLRVLIPICRNAVSSREASKSIIIKVVDYFREAFRKLEDKMVEEGRLPERELLYFLTQFEIYELLHNRSPNLIQKAIRRKHAYKEMDSLIFPEIMVGVPRPITMKKDNCKYEASFTMKGVPVSQGIAKGLARVATSLEMAADIQPGEILIAYSTDIGWSPYFPMLAGVATELGGLISHGAVVAREYGLPCVVALHEATQHFCTGDLVVLDGNNGTLEKINQTKDTGNGVPNGHKQ